MTVLLDLDGCILDSAEPILGSLSAALESFGLAPVTRDDLGWLVGPPLAENAPRLLAERGADHVSPDELIARYRDDYRDRSVTGARTYPGIPEAVERLAERGPVGVVTSKPRVYALPILGALGLLDCFAVVEGPSQSEAESKVTTLERALVHLGRPDRPDVAMVGDRRHDIDAGKAHGVHTVGVTWGFGTRAELEAAGADAIVEAPGELLAVVTWRR